MLTLKGLWALISGSKFIWSIIKNHVVLGDSLKAIEITLTEMRQGDSVVPNHMQAQNLMLAVSNILKTGVIDFPGIDEYEIAIGIDRVSSDMTISLKDSKSGKFHELPILKGK